MICWWGKMGMWIEIDPEILYPVFLENFLP